MPEEARPGVSGAPSPGAQAGSTGVTNASSPEASGQPGAGSGNAAGAKDPNTTGNQDQPGPIPYERFHQVNDEKNRAVAQAAALEAYTRQLALAYQDLQSRVNAQSAQSAPTPADDPLEQVVTTRLGSDETGQQVRETIAAVVQLELKKALKGSGTGQGVGRDEIMQIVSGVVAQAMAPNTINSQLQQWKSEGRIAEADIPVVSQEMTDMIAAQPGWGQGENIRLLPIVALGSVVAKGKLKSTVVVPTAPTPPGTPLQAGRPSSPIVDSGDALRVAEAVVSRFAKLSKVDPQVLAKKYRDNPLDPYHGETVFGSRR